MISCSIVRNFHVLNYVFKILCLFRAVVLFKLLVEVLCLNNFDSWSKTLYSKSITLLLHNWQRLSFRTVYCRNVHNWCSIWIICWHCWLWKRHLIVKCWRVYFVFWNILFLISAFLAKFRKVVALHDLETPGSTKDDRTAEVSDVFAMNESAIVRYTDGKKTGRLHEQLMRLNNGNMFYNDFGGVTAEDIIGKPVASFLQSSAGFPFYCTRPAIMERLQLTKETAIRAWNKVCRKLFYVYKNEFWITLHVYSFINLFCPYIPSGHDTIIMTYP